MIPFNGIIGRKYEFISTDLVIFSKNAQFVSIAYNNNTVIPLIRLP